MTELDPPLKATISTFDQTEEVGRLRAENGEEFRFGRSACRGFAPNVGQEVFVTVAQAHPLGGRRASKLRLEGRTEQEIRTADALQQERSAQLARADADRRRTAIAPLLTEENVITRVRQSVVPEEHHQADKAQLYALVEDLELVGKSETHVAAILKGIASAHPLAHFGSPGPLVHYVESFHTYTEALFAIAPGAPTSQFLSLLARIVNGDDRGKADHAIAIFRSYAIDPRAPDELRARVSGFLSRH